MINMKRYDEYTSVEELYEAYNIKPLKNYLTEKKEEQPKIKSKKEAEEAEKVVKTDKLEVVYADLKPKKFNNIFKHIIVFTNDKDTKNNKTLANIEDAIKRLKKDKAEIIPELHVFVAAEIQVDDSETEIIITDGDSEFKINKESNLDTLVFSRLGVQDEDNAEHIVKVLQDRGFLVLNPVAYSALACNKYDSAVLFKKGEIPQPNFTLMTKEILYDEKQYNDAMREIYPKWNDKDPDKNKDFTFVMKMVVLV